MSSYDTAGSAKMIKEKKLRNCAAIASKRAADIYGLEILAPEIETSVNNYTKFVAISKQKAKPAQRNKTSLVLLLNISLAPYTEFWVSSPQEYKFNKTGVQTEPTKPWEYVFMLISRAT